MNCVAGEWTQGASHDTVEVFNPATAEVLASVPLASREDAEARSTPPQPRFRIGEGLRRRTAFNISSNSGSSSNSTPMRSRAHHPGKRQDVRGIQSGASARHRERRSRLRHPDPDAGLQPGRCGKRHRRDYDPATLGVTAAITPFNFPAMIPLWFLPYAIACGNTFILKPSERVPLTARRLIELLHQTGIPKGVVNLLVGGKER